MELVFRICLFVAGFINFAPVTLGFIPSKIKKVYGLEFLDPNFELLLRHRAILFGIVGGLMIYSALFGILFKLSAFIGMISMISFLVFYFQNEGLKNEKLKRVMQIDLLGIILLAFGFLLYCLS